MSSMSCAFLGSLASSRSSEKCVRLSRVLACFSCPSRSITVCWPHLRQRCSALLFTENTKLPAAKYSSLLTFMVTNTDGPSVAADSRPAAFDGGGEQPAGVGEEPRAGRFRRAGRGEEKGILLVYTSCPFSVNEYNSAVSSPCSSKFGSKLAWNHSTGGRDALWGWSFFPPPVSGHL